MTSIFTKYSELDPALEARQIEAAHGGPVFDKWSFLDEARFNAQAAAALGVTLDVAASLDPRRLRDELETFVATYVPRGIKFDGATLLINNALVAVENGKLSCSVIFMSDDPAGQGSTSNAEPILWIVDPIVIYQTFLGIIGSNGNAEANQINIDIMNAAGTNLLAFNGDVTWRSYVHIIATAETNADIGSKKFKMKINGIDGTVLIGDDDNASITKYNGLPFYVGGDSFDGDFFKGNMADLWVAPGVSLLDADGNIPQATLEKFFKRGLPQNPKGFPAGAAVLLSASGNDPDSFALNDGDGGPFTVTGALEFAAFDPNDVVWDASKSTATVLSYSSDGLTATQTVDSASEIAVTVTNVFRASGKFYFETTIVVREFNIYVGLANTSQSVDLTATLLGDAPGNSVVSYDDVGGTFLNGAQVGITESSGVGDVVGQAIDLDARLLWVRVNGGHWNADPLANPITGVGGTDISSLEGSLSPVAQSFSLLDSLTANFGKTPYAHPAPAGFSNWTKGAPDWLPEGALAIADFVNGRYYDGVSEVAATDMLYAEATYGNFDPATDIVPGVGLRPVNLATDGTFPAAKGSLLSLILAGCTLVFDFNLTSGNFGFDLYADAGFTHDYGASMRGTEDGTDGSYYTFDGNAYVTVDSQPNLANGDYKVAMTILDTKIAHSLNGAAAIAHTFAPLTGAFHLFAMGPFHSGLVRSMTIYSPQDDAALPALSALS